MTGLVVQSKTEIEERPFDDGADSLAAWAYSLQSRAKQSATRPAGYYDALRRMLPATGAWR